ncbi:MAG TPA: LysM peptidoglycan-binding domain-containing protein, partial [Bacillota bacterium]|nr:LysM peptidoglycan-binding domain-containing protein [Bacillota bacterium]
ITICPDVQKNLSALIAAPQSSEAGGILVGSRTSQAGSIQVMVQGALQAKTRENFSREFHYQHHIWRELYQAKAELYPNLEIVGWFHSGSSPVTTAVDLEIHNAFFPEEYQVLLVVNSSGSPLACYHMQKGELITAEVIAAEAFTGLADNISAWTDTAAAAAPAPTVKAGTTNSIPLGLELTLQMKVMVGLAICLTLITLAFFPIIRPIESDPQTKPVQPTAPFAHSEPLQQPQASPQQPQAGQHQSQASQLKPQVTQQVPTSQQSAGDAPEQPKDASQAKRAAKNADAGERRYVVKRGDSLWKISEAFYGSGFDFYKLIRANGIATPGNLYVGMVLIIPDK